MPPNTIMHGGVLPLERILSLPSTLKSKPPAPTPPPEFTQTLLLDSTLFLSGLLRWLSQVRYAIATSGSTTVITRPSQSRNVAKIQWVNGGRTVIETEDIRLRMDEWVKVGRWGGAKTLTFKKWGRNPEIKWSAKGAEWEATNTKNQVLAALVSRRGALGTRLELTDVGEAHADALVLTALLTVTGDQEWRWYSFVQGRREAAADRTGRSVPDGEGETGVELNSEGNGEPPENLPTYREAPFTRPLGPLLRPHTSDPNPSEGDDLAPPTDQPLTLVLSSRRLLAGTFCEEDQPVVYIRTLGPRTTINWFGREVGSVEWAAGRVMVGGNEVGMGDVIGKKSLVFGKRKTHNCTFPTLSLHWTETSRTSTASIYPDPNTHIRYACRTNPSNRPLGIFTHYLKRKGSILELTPEGHTSLAEVLVGLLVVLCGDGEWKRVTGAGITAGREGEGEELVLGEEMVSDLDGWAGPEELMRLRRDGGPQSEE